MTDTWNDVQAGAFADDDECDSPYCSRNPHAHGTYEAYSGALCDRCAERERDEEDLAEARTHDDDSDLMAVPA